MSETGSETRAGFVVGVQVVPGVLQVATDTSVSAGCLGMTFRHPPRPDHTLIFGVASINLLIAELGSDEVETAVLEAATSAPVLFKAKQEQFRQVSDSTESPLNPANLLTFAERSLVMSVQRTMTTDSLLLTVGLVGGANYELLLPLVAIPALIAAVVEYFPDDVS